jgi:LmbE family N-acetylglucosaminyl deacetylase
MQRGIAAFAAQPGADFPSPDDMSQLGKPELEITAAVDVTAYLDGKREAMRAHASQISEQSFFLAMPADGFRYAFGTEWFIRQGQGPGITETDLFG